jgi:poly(ADP-ribose) glycohydrolase ARH3
MRPPGTRSLRQVTQTSARTGIATGVLLGTFLGDAVAARWEGADAVTLDRARQRLATSLEAETLTYTDDTQLALALAEHLCEHPDVEPAELAATFLEHFEPHRGYARGMFGIVEAWRSGQDVADAARSVFPEGSFGNGAAMRVAPVGVVWDDPFVAAAAAQRQAVLTHAHPIGIDGAVVQACAVALAARQGVFAVADVPVVAAMCETSEMRRALAVAADPSLSPEAVGLPGVAATIGTGVLADQSVPAALWVAAHADDVADAVLLSLALGGDADTIAAMACAVLGAAQGPDALPAHWVRKLEDGPRGLRYARDLAQRLARAADAVTPPGT